MINEYGFIVIPDNPADVEKTAAEEVAAYLEKALCIKLPVILENEAKGKCIYIGHQTDSARLLQKHLFLP